MKNLFPINERFGLLGNATFASNKIMQNMCITINSHIWATDYITNQPPVLKFG